MSSCIAPQPIPIPTTSSDRQAIDALMDILVENNQNAGLCYIKTEGWQKWYRMNKELLDEGGKL